MKKLLPLLLCLFAPIAWGQTSISGLPAASTSTTGTEIFPVVQSSTTKKMTLAQVLAWLEANPFALAAANSGALSNLSVQNTTAGTGAWLDSLFLNDASSGLHLGATSSIYSGSLLTNGLSGAQGLLYSDYGLQLGTGGQISRVNITSAGNTTINAPTSGVTFTANGLNGSAVYAANSTSAASSLLLGYGIGGLPNTWSLLAQSTDPLNIGTNGARSLQLMTNGAARLTISSVGAVTIGAPSSSANPTFVITGPDSNYAQQLQGSTNTGLSFGQIIDAGTNSSDTALLINNASGGTQLLRLYGDGGVAIGNPTGGDEGAGTINVASNYYVQGSAIAIATSGTFTLTYSSGCSSGSVAPTFSYVITGQAAVLTVTGGTLTCTTTSSSGIIMTGLPVALQPASTHYAGTELENGGVPSFGFFKTTASSGTVTLALATGTFSGVAGIFTNGTTFATALN